jgi:hypothetical protein
MLSLCTAEEVLLIATLEILAILLWISTRARAAYTADKATS